MFDIHDGAAYQSLAIGLKRIIEEATRHVKDIEVAPGSKITLVLCKLGLNMTVNMDWYYSLSASLSIAN
jgi:hypothetical protein